MARNLMEEKQLNFNAPLMSVRRFSSQATAASDGKDGNKIQKSSPKRHSVPYYKSELKSGPITNAGAVPFLWEQIPGRPKDGGESRFKPPELPPVAPPKLPPGRVLDVKQQSSSTKNAEGKDPGTPRVIQPQNDNSVSTTRPDVSSSNGNVVSKEDAKEEKNHDLEDSDDAFSDALDTLSRSESFFMNCSVSGLSALDGPDLKLSGRDQQARDFMIDRFLPAAKAMASETPQYAPRNKASARESTREVHRIRQPQPRQFRPYVLPQHPQVKEESDDEDEDCDDAGNLSAKACGILPQFCLKSSFFLLNPVPGMKIRGRMPSPIRCNLNVQRKGASHGSRCETDDEHSWEAVYKYKLARGIQPHSAQESASKLSSESNQLTYWSDSQTPDGSSPYRRSAGDVISPYRNEAPQSPFHEGKGFLGIPKQGNNIRDESYTLGKLHDSFEGMPSDHSSQRGSGSASPAIEKTLYVDSVHMLGTPNSRSSSADTKELLLPVCKEPEILVGSERLEGSAILESHLGEAKQLSISKEMDSLQSRFSGIVELEPPASILGGQAENKEGFQHKDGLYQEASLPCSELPDNDTQVINGSQHLGSEDKGDSYSGPVQSPLPPPLPKSPSESWLCRTLPSVSSLNPSSRSYLGVQFRSRKPALKQSMTNPKWETIVKTSNVPRGHVRFSEELKKPVSKQSET